MIAPSSFPPSLPSLLLFLYSCSCCNSTVTGDILSSCTNPLYNYLNGIGQPTRSQFCPSPPKLSYSAASQPSGPLENENVYVAELLLRTASDLTPDVFFRRFQAGFSLTTGEPRHSVCGCSQPEDVCDGPYFSALNSGVDNETDMRGNITRYFFNQSCADVWALFALDLNCTAARFAMLSIPGCSDLDFTMADSVLECNGSTSMESYQVDGLASNLLKVLWPFVDTVHCSVYSLCFCAIAVWSMWKPQQLW